jgi:hypothetical protein
VISLSSTDWFRDVYVKIYEILALDDRLPSPDNIYLLDDKDVDVQHIPEITLAFALQDKKYIWFREKPPSPITFTHELIHLCKKKDDKIWEEVYGYNLASFVVLLAQNDIKPRKNPLILFESVSLDHLLEALRQVYHYPFRDICEYFYFIGVIPIFIELKETFNGKLILKIDQKYDEKSVVIASISELASGAYYDELMLNTLLKLLE